MLVFPKDIYRFFATLPTSSPPVFYTLLCWMLLELGAAFVLPSVLDDAHYFSGYVQDKARVSTARFLRGENANIPDPDSGWRNKPNVQLHDWVIDRFGSRSSRPLDLQHKSTPYRAVFFGSSMVNGGEGVTNQQTISAGIESGQVESFNFASMAFSIDQSLLLYRTLADRLQADDVIVGLDADPVEGLYNHYIPLKLREEVGVPYLKPRFALEKDGQLRLIPMDLQWLAQLDQPAAFLDFLRQNDGYYSRLRDYARCDFTPLAHGLCWLHNKAESSLAYMQGAARASDPLLEAVVRRFDAEVKQRNGRLVVMVLPSERMFHWRGVWKYFPDIYALRVQALQAQGVTVLDVRALFRASGKGADELFAADHHHFSAVGNRVVADGLRKQLAR